MGDQKAQTARREVKCAVKPAALALLATIVFASCRKDAPTYIYHTVTFDANGGTLAGRATVTVKEGDPLPSDIYAVAERESHWLRGWYLETEAVNQWESDNVVTRDMTLYAGWERKYTITFHANGGRFLNREGSETETSESSAGGVLWIPDNVAKPGYVLEGWYRDAAFTRRWDFETDRVEYQMELHAKWDAGIEGLTLENYPRVDGATSTRALNNMVACKLLGLPYLWQPVPQARELSVYPKGEFGFCDPSILEGRVTTSQTHGAMMNLIEGKAEIILRSTTASPDERAAAAAAGVTLVETPIALDAFVFIKHVTNPVQSLTLEQIRGIYTGRFSDWAQVGGKAGAIHVYTRPRNSGSEEAFRELVMNGLEPAEFPEEQQVMSMQGLFWEIERNPLGISYIFKNYKEMIMRRYDSVLAIDGISPTAVTMRDRTYPLTTEVYAIVRSDLDHGSMAFRLYEWLRGESARGVLEECGFTPR